MRRTALLMAGLAFAAAPAFAQSAAPADPSPPREAAPPAVQPATPQSQAPAEAAPGVPAIQSISVVDFTELPAETQGQVDKLSKERGEEELVKLRSTLDSVPQISSALKEKGFTSADVVVASLSPNGALTLVTRKQPG